MVFEGLAQIILSRLLDKVFYGINKNNIQVALLDGRFVISNIGLNKALVTQLNLPVQVKYSYVQRVEINLPWRSDEVSISINISNIYLLITNTKNNPDIYYQSFIQKKQKIVEQALKEFKANLKKKQNSNKQYGFIEKIFLNLLDNINIKIQCIHLRYENKDKNYSFGVKINEVSARTVNQFDQPTFFNRQKSNEEYVRYILQIDFMGIYFNSKQSYFLSQHNLSQAQITIQFNKLSHKIIQNYQDNFDNQQQNINYNYIFTISIKTILKKYIHVLQQFNNNKDQRYLFQCQINLNNIQSKLSDQQYYDLLDFLNFILDHQKNCQDLVQRYHIPTYKEKTSKEISDFLKKKSKIKMGKKQKQTFIRAKQRYFGSIFMHVYLQILKKTFIREAIKKQIDFKHLKANNKTFRIMKKIDNQKLKQWILISLYYRKKYEQKVNFFFRGSTQKIQSFSSKYLNNDTFNQPYEFEDQISKSREQSSQNKYQVFLKLNLNIKSFNFQISRQNDLGVGVNLQKLKIELIVRKKNYIIKMSIQDLEANVFTSKKYQKKKTNVPIIQRNCILDKQINLLEITYQRNPVGRPFVFTQIIAEFQSIQVTIYPQIFNQFYQILLGGNESQKKTKKKTEKHKEATLNEIPSAKQIGHQKTIIKAKVRSPYILLPFTSTNNPSQQCWIVRLGDFYVDTLIKQFSQNQSKEDLFYDHYKIELKKFQFSYFSSINFFHNWLKLNYNMQSVRKIKSYANQKIISVILPLSCLVELSLLKSSLSLGTKDRKAKAIGRIQIDQIQIRISKFVLNRLKTRFDNFQGNKQEVNEFIEKNVGNIKQQNQMKGQCKISYGNIKKMPFYCILKGSFIYFFLNQNHPRYHFFANLNQTAIRFISNEVENFNTHQPKLLCFYFKNKENHYAWRKKILLILSKKQRLVDNTIFNSFRSTNSYDESRRSIKEKLSSSNKSIYKEEVDIKNNHQPSSKLNMKFFMNKLSIILYEEDDQQFLNFHIKKASFQYSTVLEKSIIFSLNYWTIKEGNGQTFVNSIDFIDEKIQENNNNVHNFLEVCCVFNSITQQLRLIEIKVDQLFLAWKVQLFTKILLFFFFEESAGDAPSPVNYNKSQLQIKITFQRFNFHCYFDAQLIALCKLQNIYVRYFQNNIEQIYDFNCKVVQMDKFVNGSKTIRLPMIRRRYTNQSQHESINNNFQLYYLLRKKDTEQFDKIGMLKQKFGNEVLITQINTVWKNTQIYFQNQLTFRLLNYIIGKVIGTIGAKFKKRQYSSNYIFQSLKTVKLTVINVQLKNFVFKMPPHQRGNRYFSCQMQNLNVLKNFDGDYMPQEVLVETIRGQQRFFWQSMLVKIANASLYYHIDCQPPLALLSAPIDINLVLSKLNFLKQFFVILNHHDDINRNYIIDVIIQKPILLQAHKIFFVTFLQLFYQNIKHKDGKAQIFQPSLPFPSLREYNIYINKIQLNMYNYLQRDNTMQIFNKFTVELFKIDYRQNSNQSILKLTAQAIKSQKQLPISSINDKRKKFSLLMESKEGEMKVVIEVQYYVLKVNLDKLNNIIEFFNYDNDYVVNKIMPKKPSSWQYVNVFAKNCELKLGQLGVQGQFYVSYLKGMQNDPDDEIKKYLSSPQQNVQGVKEIDWSDITDKQIKVNGEDIRLNIGGDSIGMGSNFCFNRIDISSKLLNKRYKRQRVQVGDIDLHMQLVDLKTLWQVYTGYISKNPKFVLKTLYQKDDSLPLKAKTIQKRHMQVQINKIQIAIIPTLKTKIFKYITINLQIPLIIYKTYLQQQQVNLNIRFSITHQKDKLKQIIVAQCPGFKLKYFNIKDKKLKKIQILSAKSIVINLVDLNNYILSNILNQSEKIKQIQRINLHIHQNKSQLKYLICMRNEINRKIKIRMNQIGSFNVDAQGEEHCYCSFNKILKWVNDNKSKIQIHQEGMDIVSKSHGDINIFQPLYINNNMLVFLPTNQKLVITYRPCLQIKNSSSCTFYFNNNRALNPFETASFFATKANTLTLSIKIGVIMKNFNINLKELQQLFGDQSFIISIIKQGNNSLYEIKDRFIIKNMIAFNIKLLNSDILAFGESSLGYLNDNDKDKLFIQVDSQDKFQFNLLNPPKYIQMAKKLTLLDDKNKQSYHKTKINLYFQTIQNNKIITTYIYSKFSIKNQCNHSLTILYKQQKIILKGKNNLILPYELQDLRWYDNDKQFQIKLDKNKIFFSQYLKFTYIQKLDKKVNILKIQNKYYFHNKTDQPIDILINEKQKQKQKQKISIMINEICQLNYTTLKKQCLSLIFGDIIKSFDLCIKGINILKIGNFFLKVTVLHQEQSRLIIIENSTIGHLIINKLEDISIIPHCYNQKEQIRHSNMYQYLKTIHPLSECYMGIEEWNHQLVQLEFYLEAKNVEFKQRFKIQFLELVNKFSHKHLIHHDKDHKIIIGLVITIQRDNFGLYTFTVMKQKVFEDLPMEILKFSIHQFSISFVLSHNLVDNVTLQCYKAHIERQKGAQLTDISLIVDKLLIRQGKGISILNALHSNHKFINAQIILNKCLRGTNIKNLVLRLVPIQLIFKQKIIFKIFLKIADIRSQMSKNKLKLKQQKKCQRSSHQGSSHDSLHSDYLQKEQLSLIQQNRERQSLQFGEEKLQKQWEGQLNKLIKGSKTLTIGNMQISQTSLLISYMRQQYRKFDEKMANDKILKYVLLMPPLSQLKISISHLTFNDFEGEKSSFAKEVINKLKQSIGSTIANSFSSLPIFDNPIIAIDGVFKYLEGILAIK